MPAGAAITREDYTAAEVRRGAARTGVANAARPLRAPAPGEDGKTRGAARALLHRLGFRRISMRPRAPQQDAATQAAHKKTLPIWSQPASHCARAASRSNFGGRMKPASASREP